MFGSPARSLTFNIGSHAESIIQKHGRLEIRDWAAVNRTFYDTFAGEFSRSREAINPGIVRALGGLDLSAVLDVGCGDGRVSKALPETCRYVGLDFSANLIGRSAGPTATFALANMASPLPVASAAFPTVVCFAALHHLTNRLPLMQNLARILRPSGQAVVSVWQITHSKRMRKKIVEDLGNDDYVLDWDRGGQGRRFVHEVHEPEMEQLAIDAGLTITELFRSDGKSGDLGLYAVMRRAI
jgi:SAM-dependent methyltransferase